ncbi:MAG: NAD(P)/FAD-dependent oxidoreductase [Candidatus Nanopelagicales bacterium]|nr:NAD(P)/FAD-dependent oxidoreductase [Candidatus Nanopelagicales bacterium]
MRVVIVGAGFGGLAAARKLSQQKDVNVTVVDKHPYQLFSPLLYQVATGGLPEDDIAYPVRAAIPGVSFRKGEVTKVNSNSKSIILADQSTIEYDHLVLATGSTGTTFGVPGVQENALQMKSILEARVIKKQLLGMYEEVEAGHKPKESLKVVVIGAGPTGVEVSGAVAELQKSMKHEFPNIYKMASVTLVEAGPRVLPMFHEKSSKHAQSELEEIGVSVKTNSAVDRMYETDVHLKSGEILSGGTLIWAAGVAAYQTWTSLGETDRSNRIKIDENLQTSAGIFVIGDGAHLQFKGNPLPMIAPVALQMGKHVAKQIISLKNNKPLSPFKYTDKGQMATIGRRRAVVEMPGGLRMHGTIAWLTWLALHVFYLAGGRNRISVIADWMWNYIAWGVGPRRTVID